MNQEFITTRPTLANALMREGFEPRIEPSIWDRSRLMWTFKRCEKLEKIVNEYYLAIGKEPLFKSASERDKVTE